MLTEAGRGIVLVGMVVAVGCGVLAAISALVGGEAGVLIAFDLGARIAFFELLGAVIGTLVAVGDSVGGADAGAAHAAIKPRIIIELVNRNNVFKGIFSFLHWQGQHN